MAGTLRTLLELPAAKRVQLTGQGEGFANEFRLRIGRVDERIQRIAGQAGREAQKPFDALRDKVTAAYQKTLKLVDPVDATKAAPAIERVLAAVDAVEQKATQAADAVSADRDQWLELEGNLDDILRQCQELEDVGHPRAPALRKVGEAARSRANVGKFREAVAVVGQLQPEFEKVVAEQAERADGDAQPEDEAPIPVGSASDLQLQSRLPPSGPPVGPTGVSAQLAPQSPPNPIDDLTKAIEADDLPLVQLLINRGINVEGHDSNDMTPLTQAAKSKKPNAFQIADLLINSGANLETAEKNDGQTPLILATQAGNRRIAGLLLRNKASVNSQDLQHRSPLFVAIHNGDTQLRDLILQHNPIVTNAADHGRTPLIEAAFKGDLDSVKLLIKHGARVTKADFNNRTALMEAARAGHDKVVEFLLQKRANPKQVDKFGETTLIDAARSGNRSVGKLLLKANADVNETNSKKRTALMEAAKGAKSDFIKELVSDRKIDVNLKDDTGSTALIEAARFGGAKTLTAILKSKRPVKVDETDDNGKTALMEAASQGRPADLIKALLAAKPKPNLDLQAKDGKTALILAVEGANVEGVKILVNAKAKVTIKDKGGGTALDIALVMQKTAMSGGTIKAFAEIVAVLKKVSPQKAQPSAKP